MFSSGMKESATNKIKIEDVDPDVFKNVLKFLYCGSLPEEFESKILVYLPIAERYGMNDLKSACVDSLRKSSSPKSVVEVLKLSHRLQFRSVKRECFEKIKKFKAEHKLKNDAIKGLLDDPDLILETVCET